MSTLPLTLDELIFSLSKYGMVPKWKGSDDWTYFDYRIIRDEDLPTPECLVTKYTFLAFEEKEAIWSILKQFTDLTHQLAIRICNFDKSSPADVKKQRMLKMLQLVAQLVTNFVFEKNSKTLFGIIFYAWRERHPESEDALTITNTLQLLGITNPQTE